MVQIAQLQALREVLDTGSFSAAGARLGLTASAVSQQIRSLERCFKVTLFERKAQSIRPTAAAVTLGVRADIVLTQIEILDREARAIAGGTRGVVRLGSFPTASARLLPGALARLADRRTGVDILLDEDEPDALLRRLQAGTLDLALVYRYDALPATWPPIVASRRLLCESLVLLSSIRGPVLMPDLRNAAETQWVASREETAGAQCLELLCSTVGFAPRIRYRSNDYEVVHGLVAAGLGAAIVPALAYKADSSTQGSRVDLDNATRTVFVIHRQNDANPLLEVVIRAFRDAANNIRSDLLRVAPR